MSTRLLVNVALIASFVIGVFVGVLVVTMVDTMITKL